MFKQRKVSYRNLDDELTAVVGEYEAPFLFAKGGKGGAPAPIATPPPVAPEPEKQETLTVADDTVATKKAKALGAKSLQIPLGTIGGNAPLNI